MIIYANVPNFDTKINSFQGPHINVIFINITEASNQSQEMLVRNAIVAMDIGLPRILAFLRRAEAILEPLQPTVALERVLQTAYVYHKRALSASCSNNGVETLVRSLRSSQIHPQLVPTGFSN